MSISNNALIFYHAYTIKSKKKSVYFTDFSIKTSFLLEYRDRFERLLGYQHPCPRSLVRGNTTSRAWVYPQLCLRAPSFPVVTELVELMLMVDWSASPIATKLFAFANTPADV